MKTIKSILKAACLALIAASCTNEIDNSVVINQKFEAGFAENAPETRIQISSDLTKVTWELTDAIGIFDAGIANPVKAIAQSTKEDGKSAIFSPVTAVVNPAYALHPYQSASKADGNVITTTIPATSTGALTESCLAVAKADDGKFWFRSISGIFQFKVSDPDVKSVVIKATGIAGGIKATVDNNGIATVAPEGTAADEITVTVAPDQVCYVAVVPKMYSGVTFTYKDKDGKVLGTTTCTDTFSVSAGDILTWGDFTKLQKAYLPAGPAFNEALKTAAGGNLANIKALAFMTGYKPSGTVINEGTEGAPIGVEYSGGNVFICTPANEFIANASMSNMFNDLNNVGIISGFEKIDTRETTDMQCVFRYCHKLTSVDLSNLNTSKVTTMLGMFYRCESLASLDVSKFDTSNVTVMQAMFGEMKSLTSLDVSNFNTQKCTNMAHMFSTLSKLEKLTLGSDFKFAANNTNMLYSLGITNSKPFTTFYCDIDQWNTVTSLIGSTDIVNYRWGNAPADAQLPSGDAFKTAVANAAGGSANVKTITFETYSSKTGTQINTGLGDTPVYVSSTSGNVTVSTQAAGFKANASTCYKMFYDFTALTAIKNFTAVNTDDATSMYGMFYNCNALTSVDLSNINTAKVTTMEFMFYECHVLPSIDLSKFNTANVTNMHSMFADCYKVTNLDVSKFNTAKVTSMWAMFYACKSLTSLDLSSFNTAAVTDMRYMFKLCEKLKSIKFGSNFTAAKVTNMRAMFHSCKALTSLDLSKFNTANVTSMEAMFSRAEALTSLDLSSFNTAKVTEMDSLLYYTPQLTAIKLGSNFKIPSPLPKNVTIDIGTYSSTQSTGVRTVLDCTYNQWISFVNLRKLDGFDVLKYRWKNVPTAAPLPAGKAFNTALKTAAGGNLANIKTVTFTPASYETNGTLVSTGTSPVYIYYSSGNITIYTPSSEFSTTSCEYYFDSCSQLTTITNLKSLNTSNTLSMGWMFDGCNKLTSIDLSNFNTAKVTDMMAMFYECNALTSLDVSKLNTANVTRMQAMFAHCIKLTSLDLSNFNTAKVTNMTYLFEDTPLLATVKLGSNFKFPSNVTGIFTDLGTSNASPYTTFTCNYTQWKFIAANVPADSGYKWGNAPTYAPLPKGTDFNAVLKTIAGGDLANIKGINFQKNYPSSKYRGTIVNPNEAGAPIYGYYDSGVITLYTASDQYMANADCSSMFKGMTDVTYIYNIAYWVSTENTTNMQNMFYDCRKLTSLNLVTSSGNTTFVTDKVTDMSYMFHYCNALPALNVTKFNTSNVTTMRAMFDECHALASLNLSSFRTDKVRDFAYMFYANKAMTSLTACFQTSAAVDMQSMFSGMTNVKSINLGSMEAANVTCMAYMFYGCSSLTSLDISHFRTSKVNTFKCMFYNTYALKTLNLGTNFTISSSANTTEMCKNLGGTSTSGYRTDIYASQATVTALRSIVDNSSYYRWYY